MIDMLLFAFAAFDFDKLSKPSARYAAVIDCQVKKAFHSYPRSSTPSQVSMERRIFRVKKWGPMERGFESYIADAYGVVHGNFASMDYWTEGDKIHLNFSYEPLSRGLIKLDSTRNGKGVINIKEKMRHGEGEYQISGECMTFVNRKPKASSQ